MSLRAGGCDRFLTLQYASSEMNKQAEITADPLLCFRLMFATKHLLRCISFLSAFFAF